MQSLSENTSRRTVPAPSGPGFLNEVALGKPFVIETDRSNLSYTERKRGQSKMSHQNVIGPAYRIHTERLILRCWDPMDAPLLKGAIDASLDHLLPWMPWAGDEPQDLQAKIELLKRFRSDFDLDRDYVYGILNRDESEVLGGTGLHTRAGPGAFEIGYWIHVAHINQGFATEAAAALTKVAFEVHQVDRVEIHCDPENVRSAAVPNKLGFAHEATLRRRTQTADGARCDSMVWTLFAQAYPGSVAAAAEIEAFDAVGHRILPTFQIRPRRC